MSKDIALVLGSGGARGLAHIGAIEELEARGYRITSIAGCSMGAMMAGMYAAGKLKEAKEWFLQVDKQLIMRMMDFTLSPNALVKGERVIKELQTVVPDCLIEELAIPLTIVSADIITADEVIFREGSLFDAIRASISIPLFFTPVQRGKQLLIDGGILNPLPLNRVARHEGDLLVAMDISGKDELELQPTESVQNKTLRMAAELVEKNIDRLPAQLQKLARNVELRHEKESSTKEHNLSGAVNYVTLVDRMSDMQIQQNSQLMVSLCPPDIRAVMPQYAYTTFDFDKAEEIIEQGRLLMRQALDRYEKQARTSASA